MSFPELAHTMRRIYLDHNATTRPDPAVIEAMLPLLGEGFGNPSSLHRFGEAARRALEQAREEVAEVLGAGPEQIVFTSGGTEAVNHALFGIARREGERRRHIVTTAIEHQAVLASCRSLQRGGFRVTYLPVDATGVVDAGRAAEALTSDTVLLSIMLANNEVGTLEPVAEIAALAHERGVLVHSDAVQALGKIRLDVGMLGVDLLSVSGHKIHGPQGVGALFVGRGIELEPLIRGGHQERSRRAGTENVAAIAGFGRACALLRERLDARTLHVAALRDRLERGLRARMPFARLHGHPTLRLPNTVNVGFPGVDAELLVLVLDQAGIAVSTGSACNASSHESSHVLLAMGIGAEEAHGSLRLSLGEANTEEDVERTLEVLQTSVESLSAV